MSNTSTTTPPKKESVIQAECFQWHWNTYPEERMQLFMVYNNGKNAAHGNILKAMGMVKGVSDMIYTTPIGPSSAPGSRTVFLECKRPGEKQSPDQLVFQFKMETLGHKYHLFHSLEEFIEIMKKYH